MNEKCFTDHRTQLRLLQARGITIKNRKKAKSILARVNYYNLINGYKGVFIDSNMVGEKYKVGTSIEEIYALYEFDRKLRGITLELLLRLENELKSIIAYVFSREHGHKDYLAYSNFDSVGEQKSKQVSELLQKLHSNIAYYTDKHESLTYYARTKQYIPLWVLVNTLSFGNISKFYSSMIQKERYEVAKRIKWGVKEHELGNYMYFLGSIRNVCAHGERLYIHKNYISLMDNRIYKYFKYRGPKNNYFAVMIALKLLLSPEVFGEYVDNVNKLFDDLNKQIQTIKIRDIEYTMGLPRNWKRIKIIR